MQVELLEATTNPEQLACRGARNDYMEEYGAEMPFSEVMDGIEPADDVPQAVWDSDVRLEVSDRDLRKMWTLIGHLMDHGHFGPFEHPQATFHVKGISRSLMAQITRHRHASFDIQSMRYVSFDDAGPSPGEAVVTIPELETREPAGRNAEISDQYKDVDDLCQLREDIYTIAMEDAFSRYNKLLDMGVAPENARMVLPIGTKVNMVFSVNARMLMHISDMRAAADAQWEIREMTEEVLDLAHEWMPLTFEYYDANLKNRKNRLAP